jgi:hypothetical protein
MQENKKEKLWTVHLAWRPEGLNAWRTEQLDCPPPALEEEVNPATTPFPCKAKAAPLLANTLGLWPMANAEDEVEIVKGLPVAVAALELVEQPPGLPLTSDDDDEPPRMTMVFLSFVPDELWQLYAIAVLGVFVIRTVAATRINPVKIKLFMFVIKVSDLSMIYN